MNVRACDAIGIDLGTTYSSLAYLDAQKVPRIVCDSSGQAVVPSVVFLDDEEIIVGEMALSQAKLRADRVVQFIKVHMGDEWRKEIDGRVHTPESISALIIGQLVREAEPEIGSVSSAVITVPAYFTEKRRRATQQAGEIAGLNVIGTLNEPMSAALAYGLHHTQKEQHAVVYDLGGGTFDVTVVRISPNEIEELATNGNRQLGGRDWDTALIDHICDDFKKMCGDDPRDDIQALQDLQIECERAKRRLGRMAKTAVRLHAFGHDHTMAVTRDQFESLTNHLVHATKLTTEIALEDSGLNWGDLSRVLLVGGSTHMPAVRNMLKGISGIVPDTGVNPVVAVALGAAIYAHVLETGEGVRAIQRPTTEAESATGEPKEEDIVEAVEVVDDGIADQPQPSDGLPPVVRFVTAHGVGVKVRSNGKWKNSVLIPRNSKVPCSVTRQFRTSRRSERAKKRIAVEITQGDNPNIDLAEILGTGSIQLPTSESGGQPVDVTLEFDCQGRLHAHSLYVRTGSKMSMTIDVKGGLHEGEVEKYRTLMQESGYSVGNSRAPLATKDNDEGDEDLPMIEVI